MVIRQELDLQIHKQYLVFQLIILKIKMLLPWGMQQGMLVRERIVWHWVIFLGLPFKVLTQLLWETLLVVVCMKSIIFYLHMVPDSNLEVLQLVYMPDNLHKEPMQFPSETLQESLFKTLVVFLLDIKQEQINKEQVVLLLVILQQIFFKVLVLLLLVIQQVNLHKVIRVSL
ncbi:MAG: hypothetical protein EBU84_10365 [Actinobacteria bacterium]|nr:hypothetical protein [Actinomycetota bacterium]